MGLFSFFAERAEDEAHSAELAYADGDAESGRAHEAKLSIWQARLVALSNHQDRGE